MYLCTPLDHFEYIRISITLIPDKVIELYNPQHKVKNEYIYMEIPILLLFEYHASCLMANHKENDKINCRGSISLLKTW